VQNGLKVQLAKEEITMPKISAVINTRNEERNIRYCLEALKWCDEIIVVDMESEDRTVEIVREYTDKIYNHEKVLAFDIAREFAVEQAGGEWILLIDADELVPKTLSVRLRGIAVNDEADAVQIPFKNYLLGEWNRHTGWWPDFHCRFFKKSMMTFSEQIHGYQHLDESAKILYLPPQEEFAVNHFAYRDVQQLLEKLNRYTTIEASQLYDQKKAFKLTKLFTSFFGEIFSRYIKAKGYKDGMPGLLISILMGVYRMVTYMKQWEFYENSNESVEYKYNRLKQDLIKD
jgi:glycosyltransferase involved in cell wall biosynthesis